VKRDVGPRRIPEGSGGQAALVLRAPTDDDLCYDPLVQTDENNRETTPEGERRKAIGLVLAGLVVAAIGLAFAIAVIHFTAHAGH